MTALSRTKKAIYVVLLCVAIAMSTWAVYNQIHSDSTAAQFADQITAFCSENPAYVTDHLNCQQAKAVQDNGSPVIQGPKGEKGDKGEQGDPGNTGPKGDSIMGQPGVDGKNGANGTNGNDGKNGVDGVDGVNGQPGEKGDKGEKGDTGAQGERGADGQPGEPAPRPQSQRFAIMNGECELVTTYDDGSTLGAKAPEVMCI